MNNLQKPSEEDSQPTTSQDTSRPGCLREVIIVKSTGTRLSMTKKWSRFATRRPEDLLKTSTDSGTQKKIEGKPKQESAKKDLEKTIQEWQLL